MRENRSICVTVKVRETITSWRATITAPSIARALELAGGAKPWCRVRLAFLIDLREFFAGSGSETTIGITGPARVA